MYYDCKKCLGIRQDLRFQPDEARVITKVLGLDKVRIYKIIERIIKLPDKEIKKLLDVIIKKFASRHIVDIRRIFKDNFDRVNDQLDFTIYNDLPLEKKLLIGSYFTMEYSIESAALFNPSIVPHPDQGNLKQGEQRVIISFRAVGEGHMSSIIFKQGVVAQNGDVKMGKSSHLVELAKVIPDATYSKRDFILKLSDLGYYQSVEKLMDELLDEFTLTELDKAIGNFRKHNNLTPTHDRAFETLFWLTRSNYEIEFSVNIDLAQMVIFPRSKTEVRAIEDARFVHFLDEKGNNRYYATYTAYDGFNILPQLIETKNFNRFRVSTLLGSGSQNKGMALFPEKINGKYVMVSRNDNENLFLMYSDKVHYWENPKLLREPKFYWETVQIGNSGSPIKTDKGWLLLTHGVGPARIYTIGAILLDLKDPSKVIGEIEEPILIPEEDERNGYVPNVVYSCGSLLHGNYLVMPYAMSDTRSGIAKFKLNELLSHMKPVEGQDK